jgi:hypothetical protein
MSLLCKFIFSTDTIVNATWIAVSGRDDVVPFYNLDSGVINGDSSARIPQDPCVAREPCDSYNICTNNLRCSGLFVVPILNMVLFLLVMINQKNLLNFWKVMTDLVTLNLILFQLSNLFPWKFLLSCNVLP